MPAGPTNDQLLDAAADQIAARGIHGATVQAVADTASSTKMTIRSRFANRQGLVDATVARAAEHWAAAAEQAATDHPDEPARAVLETTGGLLGPPHHPHVVLLALLEAPDGTDAHRHARDCTQRLSTAVAPAGTDAETLLAQLLGATAIAVAEGDPRALLAAAASTENQ